jgi:hypothetical protein
MQATNEQRQLAIDALGDSMFVTCPVCKSGKYGGIFYRCCDNVKCALYDSFAMGACGICRAIRRECSC